MQLTDTLMILLLTATSSFVAAKPRAHNGIGSSSSAVASGNVNVMPPTPMTSTFLSAALPSSFVTTTKPASSKPTKQFNTPSIGGASANFSSSSSGGGSGKGGIKGAAPISNFTNEWHHFECGTNSSHASDHLMVTIDGLHNTSLETGLEPGLLNPFGKGSSKSGSLFARAKNAVVNAPISVDTYIHVVTTSAHSSLISQAQVQQQLNAMNAAYAPANILFNLKNATFTTNDAWAIGASNSDDVAMKQALRQGTYAALNLYFQSDIAGGVLGRCTLPAPVPAGTDPSLYVQDGCNIAAGTMPDGPIYGYNMGKTAVHETGHWLGLLHTFEGYSCSGNGDFVADTPSESQSTNGCPANPWKNSCGNQRPGVDPIHNYMDYSTDACYWRFSPGQMARMRGLWPQYRQGK